MMNRRSFLIGAGLASTIASGLYTGRATAKSLKSVDRFLVVIDMPGGWDTTLSLDPWVDVDRPASTDLFIEYRDDEVLRVGGLALGPAMQSMAPFAKDISIINGVFLNSSDNGHPASNLYVFSGDPLLRAPSMSIEFNRSIRSGPFGVVTNRGLPLGGRAETITTFSELISIPNLDNPIERMRVMLANLKDESDLLAAARIIAGSSAEYNELLRLIKLEAALGEVSEIVAIKAAFLSGASAVAHLNLQTSFDTHGNHEKEHLRQQAEGWEKVSALFKLFKETEFRNSGESLFDRTTFLVGSEFSRTAALNAAKGKDHNPLTNSYLIAGRGVNGGQTVGASKLVTIAESKNAFSYQVGLPFDFVSQTVSSPVAPTATTFITPATVVRTLAEICAVDWGAFQTVSNSAPYLAGVVRT